MHDHRDSWDGMRGLCPDLRQELKLARSIRSLVTELAREGADAFSAHRGAGAGPGSRAEGDFPYPALCLRFLLCARDTFDAVAHVLSARLLVQVQVLMRTFFEAVTNVLYISLDAAARTHQFVTYISAEKKRGQDKTSELAPSAAVVDPTRSERIDREYEWVKALHGDRRGRPKRSWHGKSFEELCRDVGKAAPGFTGLYPALYCGYSSAVHASTLSVLVYDHLAPDEPQFKAAAEVRVAWAHVLSAAYLLFLAAWAANAACVLGFDRRLRDWYRAFEHLGGDGGSEGRAEG